MKCPWYIPSWNGDLRIEPDAKDPQKTEIRIFKPTAGEIEALNRLGPIFVEKGWLEKWTPFESSWTNRVGWTSVLSLDVPLEKVGPVVVSTIKPGPAVLTAIRFKDGRVETSSDSLAELVALSEKAAEEPPEKAATAAATVKRPTPCCPQCIPGAIPAASEVLLAFLDSQQHTDWAEKRTMLVTGGESGHTYLLAHRHTKTAQKVGRICFDLDDGEVVHFHDWTVPPEEEILAAKLILEHREPWLRNEATLWTRPDLLRFKNPFGDVRDGTFDASLAEGFGWGIWHAAKAHVEGS